jgi:hypothetical protein
LGLTVFVKHLVKLVKQDPQSALREEKRVKETETSKFIWLSSSSSLPSGEKTVKWLEMAIVFSDFVPYYSKKCLQTLPLYS